MHDYACMILCMILCMKEQTEVAVLLSLGFMFGQKGLTALLLGGREILSFRRVDPFAPIELLESSRITSDRTQLG